MMAGYFGCTCHPMSSPNIYLRDFMMSTTELTHVSIRPIKYPWTTKDGGLPLQTFPSLSVSSSMRALPLGIIPVLKVSWHKTRVLRWIESGF